MNNEDVKGKKGYLTMIGTNQCSFRMTDGPAAVSGSEDATEPITDEYGNPIKGERDPRQEAGFAEANNNRKAENQTTVPYYGNYSDDQWNDYSSGQWTEDSSGQWTDYSDNQWSDNSSTQWTETTTAQWYDNSGGDYYGEGQESGGYSGETTDYSGYSDTGAAQDAQW
jgi:cell division protein FtsQ